MEFRAVGAEGGVGGGNRICKSPGQTFIKCDVPWIQVSSLIGLACEDPHQDDDVFHPGDDSNQSRPHIEQVPSSLSLSPLFSRVVWLRQKKPCPGVIDATREGLSPAQWDDKLYFGVHSTNVFW